MSSVEVGTLGPEMEAVVAAAVIGESPYNTQEFAILEQPDAHASDVSLAGLTTEELKEGLRAANYRWYEGVEKGYPDLELRGEKVADACIDELARRNAYQTHHKAKNKLAAFVTRAFDRVFGS